LLWLPHPESGADKCNQGSYGVALTAVMAAVFALTTIAT
jgi:hypothetical protein